MWKFAKRHPWRVFTVIQVAGVLCAAILPESAGDLLPPFLTLLAGLVLLLPGCLIAPVLLGPLLEPTGLMPKTAELLGFMAAAILNAGVFAAFTKMNWRPRLAVTFRTWLWIAGLANATALAFMCLWFPRAGWEALFDRPHVQRVVTSALLTLVTLAVIAASLLLRGGFQPASWIVVIVQFLRLLPASQAMETWPGGDDGPGMAWAGVVIPFTWILALGGAATCAWCSLRAVRAPHGLPNDRE